VTLPCQHHNDICYPHCHAHQKPTLFVIPPMCSPLSYPVGPVVSKCNTHPFLSLLTSGNSLLSFSVEIRIKPPLKIRRKSSNAIKTFNQSVSILLPSVRLHVLCLLEQHRSLLKVPLQSVFSRLFPSLLRLDCSAHHKPKKKYLKSAVWYSAIGCTMFASIVGTGVSDLRYIVPIRSCIITWVAI
jgi:hypothetical protein